MFAYPKIPFVSLVVNNELLLQNNPYKVSNGLKYLF